MRAERPAGDAVAGCPNREDRRIDGEAHFGEDLESPEIVGTDREVLRAEGRHWHACRVFYRLSRTLELLP